MHLAAALFLSTRPRQWPKNAFVFAALLFSKNAFHLPMLGKTIAGFIVLCLITGATYLFNDIIDRHQDRIHPEKSKRPVAAGLLAVPIAAFAASLIAIAGVGLSLPLDRRFFIVALVYLALQLGYSTLLKRIVILDVLAITTGFVLRVLAGGVIINVGISSWLLVCTFLLALFLALCKRRHELMLFGDGAGTHRSVLGDYSIPLVDQMISVTTASTVLAYTLYTMSEQTIAKFGTERLVYTVPFVVYGIFRYLYIVHIRKEGGSPETILVTDPPFIAGILLWAITAGAIIYF
ncbi:MAG: decaprenyl-phosphate phosphoribosyltransferase [Chitinispirillaceae bacterium]|nr:decaprenyl-phosphate phosphoribosyltransferase [Chitinispirillaceae bacterium]